MAKKKKKKKVDKVTLMKSVLMSGQYALNQHLPVIVDKEEKRKKKISIKDIDDYF